MAMARMKKSAPRAMAEVDLLCEEECDEAPCCDDDEAVDEDVQRRGAQRQLYQAPDKTKELAETHYYQVRQDQLNAGLIPLNEFWSDFAAHMASHGSSSPRPPFLSKSALLPTRSLTEGLMAIAVLDLPLVPTAEPDVAIAEGQLKYLARDPLLCFYKDMVAVAEPTTAQTVLVGQNYFDPADRYEYVKGSQVEKYLPSLEFLHQKLYSCQVVITNVSAATRRLAVLLQIPEGAVPVSNGFTLKTSQITLGAYTTERIQYSFYFPALGSYTHYPVHVAQDEALVAFAHPVSLTVVNRPTVINNTSWQYISQQGTNDQVIEYLSTKSLASIDLSAVCWRLRDGDMFRRVITVLRRRLAFDVAVWSYGFLHADVETVREVVYNSQPRFLAPHFSSPFLHVAGEALVDDVDGGTAAFDSLYEHREYEPIVNARAHQLGKKRKILNRTAAKSYRRLLEVLATKSARDIGVPDLLAVTYHFLIQDRIEEAIATFARLSGPHAFHGALARAGSAVLRDTGAGAGAGAGSGSTAAEHTEWADLQMQYLRAYLAMYGPEGPTVAGAIAETFITHPVPRWSRRFAEIKQQLVEASTAVASAAPVAVSADASREQRLTSLAASEPTLSLAFDGRTIVLSHTNVSNLCLRFYPMDLELLFSTSPFVSSGGSKSGGTSFSHLRPNKVVAVDPAALAASHGELRLALPAEFEAANVMVEVVGDSVRCQEAYYANALTVAVTESYGQLRVASAKTHLPMPKVYVKVYSRRSPSDAGQFYKDGYTDIRGVFDYVSLSTSELSNVERFSILVVSDGAGSVVREARPPKQ